MHRAYKGSIAHEYGLETLETLLETPRRPALKSPWRPQGLSVLASLLARSEALGATARCAIATEVFCKARNGAAYLARVRKELALAVEVLSQQEEAEVGYATGVALSDVEEVICWDSGGGSDGVG